MHSACEKRALAGRFTQPHSMQDALLKAQLDFTPLPAKERKVPGRVRTVPGRFRIDEFEEHEEVFEFMSSLPHGEAPKVLVRALLHFRDSVIEPLANGKADDAQLLQLARGEMTRKPVSRSRRKLRVKNFSVRLYIDRYREHREAAEFLQRMQEAERAGNKTIIRALLHYRDTVYLPLQKRRVRRRRSAAGSS